MGLGVEHRVHAAKPPSLTIGLNRNHAVAGSEVPDTLVPTHRNDPHLSARNETLSTRTEDMGVGSRSKRDERDGRRRRRRPRGWSCDQRRNRNPMVTNTAISKNTTTVAKTS